MGLKKVLVEIKSVEYYVIVDIDDSDDWRPHVFACYRTNQKMPRLSDRPIGQMYFSGDRKNIRVLDKEFRDVVIDEVAIRGRIKSVSSLEKI